MPYSHEIDDTIIDLLYKDWDKQSQPRKLGFNQLLVEISRHRNKVISRDILSDHLTMLEQKKIIYREEFKPGVERYIWLTKNAMYARKLGWPIIVNSKRKAKSYRIIYEIIKSNTNKYKISHLLFTLFAHNGAVQETPPEYRQEYKIQYSTISIPGFSISELFYEKRKNIFGYRSITRASSIDLKQNDILIH